MARRKPSDDGPKKPTELLVPREEARSRIHVRIQKAQDLKAAQIGSQQEFESARNEYYKWDSFNTELLKRLFTTEDLANEYAWFGMTSMHMREPSIGQKISEMFKNIDDKAHRLDSIIERLELIPLASGLTAAQSPALEAAKSNRVFIVHGHDDLAKASLEVFLRELGLDPIVLHRQADEGLTVIEKFEKHSDVGYAFILLTPDEVAYLKTEEGKDDDDRKKERRARPNVIFEFGYFVGKLGRSRVCCLHTGDVALPSDVSGMIYKRYSASIEEVAYSIIKDLRVSGYQISVA